MRILVVEDDAILADGIRAGLGLSNGTVEVVTNCADCRCALATTEFDVIVLDLMLPDGSGLDVLRDLRAAGDPTPVILLTARDEVADRIRGLDSGADDYLGKPYDLDELAARVRAAARRGLGRATASLAWAGIVVEPGSVAATRDGHPVQLSRREFAVLEALMERPTTILSKQDLEARLYGWQEEVGSNTVEVHIHHLRAKIGRDAIETIRGLGYRMRSQS